MSGLFGSSSRSLPPVSAPPPQIDDAMARLNESERAAKRSGRKTTILTGDSGLPDLGSTTKVGQ